MVENSARKKFVLALFRRFSWFGQHAAFAVPDEVRGFFQIFFKSFLDSMIADHIFQFINFFDPLNHPGGPKVISRKSTFLKTEAQAPLKSRNQV